MRAKVLSPKRCWDAGGDEIGAGVREGEGGAFGERLDTSMICPMTQAVMGCGVFEEVLEHAEALAFGDEVEAGALVHQVHDGAGGLLHLQTEELVLEGAHAVGACTGRRPSGGVASCTTSVR